MFRSGGRIALVMWGALGCSESMLAPRPDGGPGSDTGAPTDVGGTPDVMPGSDGGLPACPTPVTSPPEAIPASPVVACQEPRINVGGGYEADVTIVSIGSGALTDCLEAYETAWSHWAPEARVLKVRNAAGVEQVFGLFLPNLAIPFQVGATVHLKYSTSAAHAFAPVYSGFEIRSAAGLLLYVGQGGRPEQIPAPAEVRLGLGAQLCAAGGCGPWGQFKLAVSISGATVDFLPGSTGRAGDYAVVVGASEQQTGNSSSCLDWYVSRTNVALAPAAPIAP